MATRIFHGKAPGARVRAGRVVALCGTTVARRDIRAGDGVTCSLCGVVMGNMATGIPGWPAGGGAG